jgi:hypothetical protein
MLKNPYPSYVLWGWHPYNMKKSSSMFALICFAYMTLLLCVIGITSHHVCMEGKYSTRIHIIQNHNIQLEMWPHFLWPTRLLAIIILEHPPNCVTLPLSSWCRPQKPMNMNQRIWLQSTPLFNNCSCPWLWLTPSFKIDPCPFFY